MDLSVLIGLALALGALLGGFMMEEGVLASLAMPSAALIVFGGTIGAAIVSFPLQRVLSLPILFKVALLSPKIDTNAILEQFVSMADLARREGLLALEDKAQSLPDAFLKKGILLVVDGSDPETVRRILETDIEAREKRHEGGYAMLEAMGGYAPTMGIIGTVLGLVHVLGSLEDPSKLGPAIAVAFVATLYGVASANILWLPLGSKLKTKSTEEAYLKGVMLEGILAVQAGDNPRVVADKLEPFLPPKAQKGDQKKASATRDPFGSDMDEAALVG
ncbi:MAG: flagellar motor protein [Chloroflexota bacterium]|nr:MAG: flagellar motor protein [Chloroflexota bacterium]